MIPIWASFSHYRAPFCCLEKSYIGLTSACYLASNSFHVYYLWVDLSNVKLHFSIELILISVRSHEVIYTDDYLDAGSLLAARGEFAGTFFLPLAFEEEDDGEEGEDAVVPMN